MVCGCVDGDGCMLMWAKTVLSWKLTASTDGSLGLACQWKPDNLEEEEEEGGSKKGGHKGRARQYTSPEEIDAQLQAEKQKARVRSRAS
ncbi:28 kDa heat- and acid-stable phosphoprotein, partial [Ophiophagus hannah]